MDHSLYEDLGGEKTVEKASAILYVNILRDERINSYFENIDIEKQKRKMSSFLTNIFGGPSLYLGKTMRKAHKKVVDKGLNDSHVDAMMECVNATLKELEIETELINKVMAAIEEHRDDVLGR
ncbi:MAG: group I truncated hemoglobin [Gammaproteobacteria bacterium]